MTAKALVCLVCLGEHDELTRAERVQRGDESDRYRCAKGHVFLVDAASGDDDVSVWPPSEALQQAISKRRAEKRVHGASGKPPSDEGNEKP